MYQFRGMIAGITALYCMASMPALAQNVLDAELLKLYGGNYQSDCNNAAAPRLRVTENALMVELSSKRLTGINVQAAHSYFGQNPPAHYQVALLSEAKGGSELLFIVYNDAKGQYVTLAGDKRVEAALGKSLLALKFRRCHANNTKEAEASSAKSASSESITQPSQLLSDTAFKSLYYKALGSKRKEGWLKKLDGPSPQLRNVKIEGTEYQVISSCKNHDCAENNLVALYSADQKLLYGKIFEHGKSTLFGAPSPSMSAELHRLWKEEWRQGQN